MDLEKVEKNVALTDKQLRFCNEYIIDFHGTNAAIRAGYPKNAANVQATDLLSRPYIKAQVKKLIDAMTGTIMISKDWVLSELLKIYFEERAKEKQNVQATTKIIELLGKHLAMFTDRIQNDVSIQVQLIDRFDNPQTALITGHTTQIHELPAPIDAEYSEDDE